MTNPLNHGTFTGRLARDPQFYKNADNSQTAYVTLAADRNFTNGGQRKTDFIDFEAFLSADYAQRDHVYKHMGKGDLITVVYALRSESWTDADGNDHYAIKHTIESVSLLEPKSVTQARKGAHPDAQAAATQSSNASSSLQDEDIQKLKALLANMQ